MAVRRSDIGDKLLAFCGDIKGWPLANNTLLVADLPNAVLSFFGPMFRYPPLPFVIGFPPARTNSQRPIPYSQFLCINEISNEFRAGILSPPLNLINDPIPKDNRCRPQFPGALFSPADNTSSLSKKDSAFASYLPITLLHIPLSLSGSFFER